MICPRGVAAWAPSLLHFLIAAYRQTFCGAALASGGSTTVNLLFCQFNGHKSSVFSKTLFYAHFPPHAKKSTLAFIAGYWLSLVRPKLGRDCRPNRRDFEKEVGAPALSWTSLRSYHSLIGIVHKLTSLLDIINCISLLFCTLARPYLSQFML